MINQFENLVGACANPTLSPLGLKTLRIVKADREAIKHFKLYSRDKRVKPKTIISKEEYLKRCANPTIAQYMSGEALIIYTGLSNCTIRNYAGVQY